MLGDDLRQGEGAAGRLVCSAGPGPVHVVGLAGAHVVLWYHRHLRERGEASDGDHGFLEDYFFCRVLTMRIVRLRMLT